MCISRGERFNFLNGCGCASHKRMSALGQKLTQSCVTTLVCLVAGADILPEGAGRQLTVRTIRPPFEA
jgi:hypothetical protein